MSSFSCSSDSSSDLTPSMPAPPMGHGGG
jgi:hypothetical protein